MARRLTETEKWRIYEDAKSRLWTDPTITSAQEYEAELQKIVKELRL